MNDNRVIILCVIIFILVSSFFFLFSFWEDEDDFPVDIVYLWVARDDPEREIYRKLEGISQNDGNSVENRFNNYEELRYSLRSIEMYCPWVNNIYIFVKDGQCPEFLNLNNEKIHLVYHSQVIPKEYLPLFNSNSIEQFIHKIPGLSDRYIYFNDDLMINQPVEKNDFFVKGIPVVNFKKNKLTNFGFVADLPYNHPMLLWYNFGVAKKLFGVDYSVAQFHTPSPCYKPWEQELAKLIKDNGFWNIRKFRTNRDIVSNNYLRNIFYELKGSEKVDWNEGYMAFVKMNNCKVNYTGYQDRKFLCVNEIAMNCKKAYFDMMNYLYPFKCQYEI